MQGRNYQSLTSEEVPAEEKKTDNLLIEELQQSEAFQNFEIQAARVPEKGVLLADFVADMASRLLL